MSLSLIQKVCHNFSTIYGLTYTLRSKSLTYEEVFSPRGLLPALLKSANQLSTLCLNKKYPVTFQDYEKSTLGFEVSVADEKIDTDLLLIIIDQLNMVTKGVRKGRVALDEWMYV